MPSDSRFDQFVFGEFIRDFDRFVEVRTPRILDGQFLRNWPERMLVPAPGGFLRPEPTSEHHKLFLESVHRDPANLERPLFFFEIADCARNTNCFEKSVAVRDYELACFNSYNAAIDLDLDRLSRLFEGIGAEVEYRKLPSDAVELDIEMVDRDTGVVFGHWEIAPFLSHVHSELQLRMTTIEHWRRQNDAKRLRPRSQQRDDRCQRRQ